MDVTLVGVRLRLEEARTLLRTEFSRLSAIDTAFSDKYWSWELLLSVGVGEEAMADKEDADEEDDAALIAPSPCALEPCLWVGCRPALSFCANALCLSVFRRNESGVSL